MYLPGWFTSSFNPTCSRCKLFKEKLGLPINLQFIYNSFMHTHESLLNAAIDMKNNGKTDKAKSALIKLIETGITKDRACYHLALICVEEGDIAKAIDYYRIAIVENPQYHKAYNNLGLLYLGQKKYTMATDCLETANELCPGDVEPIVNLGNAYYQQQDMGGALQYYEQVADINGLNIEIKKEVLVSMGDCYLQSRDFDMAEKIYERVITDMDKDNPIALNQLGFIQLEVRQNYDRASEFIDRALTLNTNFKPAIQNKGLILKAKGNYEEALPYLTKVVALDPDDFEGHYNLASLYSAMQQENEVKTFLQKALELAPFVKNHVSQDADFDNYKTKHWFKNLGN